MHSSLGFGDGDRMSPVSFHVDGDGRMILDWEFPVAIMSHNNRDSHKAPLLAPPLPPPPPMTHAEMMAKMLAARHEAIGGFARGGHGGNGRNGGGARGPDGPCSYQDFMKTHPPTFTSTVEPLDVEHWLRILEQKF